ncbi:MAG: pyridoxal 5'-phosphate synthase glutaminase subunit PdxT [Candidatus Dormibacteria bacterium]
MGVLALQGDVREHLAALDSIEVEAVPVRTADEVGAVDGLVLPGGESTTMSRLLRIFNLEDPLRERLDGGMPTLSTCAGAILLGREILDGRLDQRPFGALDITTRRNAYGRQINSFETQLAIATIGAPTFPAVFIRAPIISAVGDDVDVLASYGGSPVMVRHGDHLLLTFHPELTGDARIHRLFAQTVRARREAAA